MATTDYLHSRCYDIQFMLRRLGYFQGTMACTPDERTIRGVRAFQRDLRLPYHGRVDALTLTKLQHCFDSRR